MIGILFLVGCLTILKTAESASWKTPALNLEDTGSSTNKYKLDLKDSDHDTGKNLVLVFFPLEELKVSLQHNEEDINSFTWTASSAESSCGQLVETEIDCTETSYWMIIKKDNEDVQIFCGDEMKFSLSSDTADCKAAEKHTDSVYFDEEYGSLNFFWARYDKGSETSCSSNEYIFFDTDEEFFTCETCPDGTESIGGQTYLCSCLAGYERDNDTTACSETEEEGYEEGGQEADGAGGGDEKEVGCEDSYSGATINNLQYVLYFAILYLYFR